MGGWAALVQLAGVAVSTEPSPTNCKAYFPFSALNVKLRSWSSEQRTLADPELFYESLQQAAIPVFDEVHRLNLMVAVDAAGRQYRAR